MNHLSLIHPDAVNDSITLTPRSINQESKVDSPSFSVIARDTLYSNEINPRPPVISNLDLNEVNKFLVENDDNDNIKTNDFTKSFSADNIKLDSPQQSSSNTRPNSTGDNITTNNEIDPDDPNAELEELEKELAKKGREYNHLLKENQKIFEKTSAKEIFLSNQEQYLIKLKEKNAATIAQDELEATVALDYMNFEISLKQSKIRDLRHHKEILDRMENENDLMENQIKEILQDFEKSGLQYSEDMHRMNKELLEYRISLEATMRKEIQLITHKHESNACDQLSEYYKNSLLLYSK
jgi:hypothetical protein